MFSISHGNKQRGWGVDTTERKGDKYGTKGEAGIRGEGGTGRRRDL
jgi:hypothetical protein